LRGLVFSHSNCSRVLIWSSTFKIGIKSQKNLSSKALTWVGRHRNSLTWPLSQEWVGRPLLFSSTIPRCSPRPPCCRSAPPPGRSHTHSQRISLPHGGWSFTCPRRSSRRRGRPDPHAPAVDLLPARPAGPARARGGAPARTLRPLLRRAAVGGQDRRRCPCCSALSPGHGTGGDPCCSGVSLLRTSFGISGA